MKIEMKIRAIVDQVDGLPKNYRDSILEFLDHNEWGVALEDLCEIIYEENIQISESVLRQIKDVSLQMGIWEDIKKRLALF